MNDSDITKNICDEHAFLWHLMICYFVEENAISSMKLITSIYSLPFNFSEKTESFLLDIWSNNDPEKIVDLAINLVSHPVFDTQRHVFLISILVNLKKITINEASRFLQPDIKNDSIELSPEVREVLDVAWLTNEDEKDHIMLPDDDDSLKKALEKVYYMELKKRPELL
jgi:hypothetical protein